MGKVAVVGSYIVALEMEADRFPYAGETVVGRNYHVTHGGKGSNMACCAARLGAESIFVAKIGRDPFGDGLMELIAREHVSSKAVMHSKLPTGVGFIVCGPRATNIIVIDMGANADLLPEDIERHRQTIEGCDVVLSPLEIPLETALAGMRLAREKGLWTILNPAPAVNLKGVDLSSVFTLTPNETEARVCLGLPPDANVTDEETALQLLELGPANVVITLGERGALWASREGLRHFPALPVAVVDTVGAGDAFNAGLATALSERWPFEESLRMAIIAASLSTRKRGTIESYPYRAEVDAHLSAGSAAC
ncbi:MAG: ribokinase [Acidobacteriaceae bacterium]|nr:ribokinase [Acidobacteriaceae bacterium]